MARIQPDDIMGHPAPLGEAETLVAEFRADRVTYWRSHLIMAVVLGAVAVDEEGHHRAGDVRDVGRIHEHLGPFDPLGEGLILARKQAGDRLTLIVEDPALLLQPLEDQVGIARDAEPFAIERRGRCWWVQPSGCGTAGWRMAPVSPYSGSMPSISEKTLLTRSRSRMRPSRPARGSPTAP